MKQIIPFGLMPLQNDEHYQFHFEVRNLINSHPSVKSGIEPLYANYESGLVKEETARQAEQGSAFTKTITDDDAYRDQIDYGTELAIESHLYHYDPVLQEKARLVMRIWDKFGNVRRLSYNKQSSATTNRNSEIKKDYANEAEAIGVTEWLKMSDAANNEFISHFGSRANKVAASISNNVKEARATVDPEYHAIIKHVNALAEVNGDADYGDFIDKVNYYINYYKTAIATRKGRDKPTPPETPAE